MSEQPTDNRDERSGRDRPGVPRWVKVFAVVGALLVVLVVVLLVSGHGPGRHGQAAAVSYRVRW